MTTYTPRIYPCLLIMLVGAVLYRIIFATKIVSK